MEPQHLPYLLNPGLCHVVPTHPETRPGMLFPLNGSFALHSGFLQTVPRGPALAFG